MDETYKSEEGTSLTSAAETLRKRAQSDKDVDENTAEPSTKKLKGVQEADGDTSGKHKHENDGCPIPSLKSSANPSGVITEFTSDESSLVMSSINIQSSSDVASPQPRQMQQVTTYPLPASTTSQEVANTSTGCLASSQTDEPASVSSTETPFPEPVKVRQKAALPESISVTTGDQATKLNFSADDSNSSKISAKSAPCEVSDKTLLNLPMKFSSPVPEIDSAGGKHGASMYQPDQAEKNIGIDLSSAPSLFIYPRYEADFTRVPTQITGAWTEYSEYPGNFLKGCKWSPDGTCLVTNSEDKTLRMFHPSLESLCGGKGLQDELISDVQIQEGELVYDYCWFPLMTGADPETCCVITSCRDTPVHMWDIVSGKLKCSFRSYDHADEVVAAHSLAFSPDGKKLYCGFNKMVRVFDTCRPGRQFQRRQTYVKQGQSGIISCIAVNPQQPTMYAAGSYSRAVAIYSEPKGNMECMFEGQVGGVTHIMFSPDGNKLYSGGRKDPEILCWDVRNPGKLLHTMQRKVLTNQRMYFDIDRSSRYFLSGNHDGSVSVWDTYCPPVEESDGEPLLHPVRTFQAHTDTCNGLSLHPHLPVLATASGQRKFWLQNEENSSSEEEEHEMTDNSLRLWWMGKT